MPEENAVVFGTVCEDPSQMSSYTKFKVHFKKWKDRSNVFQDLLESLNR